PSYLLSVPTRRSSDLLLRVASVVEADAPDHGGRDRREQLRHVDGRVGGFEGPEQIAPEEHRTPVRLFCGVGHLAIVGEAADDAHGCTFYDRRRLGRAGRPGTRQRTTMPPLAVESASVGPPPRTTSCTRRLSVRPSERGTCTSNDPEAIRASRVKPASCGTWTLTEPDAVEIF